MSSSYLFTNNAASTLASDISAVATSLTLDTTTGSVFPNPSAGQFFYVTLQNTAGTVVEIVKCTARSGDVLTIVRGQDNTSASAFITGDKVELRLTAGELNQLFSGTVQGGGTDQVFIENGVTVTTNYTLSTGKNALSVGPVTVNGGVTVTIPSGQRWVVL